MERGDNSKGNESNITVLSFDLPPNILTSLRTVVVVLRLDLFVRKAYQKGIIFKRGDLAFNVFPTLIYDLLTKKWTKHTYT